MELAGAPGHGLDAPTLENVGREPVNSQCEGMSLEEVSP
jgi:hypothetical protein